MDEGSARALFVGEKKIKMKKKTNKKEEIFIILQTQPPLIQDKRVINIEYYF